MDEALSRVDSGCGLERLVALHLNDSKTPLGSNRDRHENMGDGDLGMDGFRAIVNEPALADLPGILEVPGFDGKGPDRRTSTRLRDSSQTDRATPPRRERARNCRGILGLRRNEGEHPDDPKAGQPAVRRTDTEAR